MLTPFIRPPDLVHDPCGFFFIYFTLVSKDTREENWNVLDLYSDIG